MKVHVFVRVGVIQRQPRLGEGSVLGMDFSPQLPADAWAEEIFEAECQLIGGKLAVGINEVRNISPRQDGGSFDDHKV
jgi:hypothetical protein